jgi:hypothetical protein
MSMLLANGNENGGLNCRMQFHDIKCAEGTTRWNTVHCTNAQENFRAGDSVELSPSVHINNYVAQVAAILKVNQQSSPQTVLLSLFLTVSQEMNIRLKPPNNRSYVHYPTKLIVWTRYVGWYPTTCIKREAFVVTPWEVEKTINDTQVSIGMNNAYCIAAKWNHDGIPTREFEPIGHGRNENIPGCLHLAMKADHGITQQYWTFRSSVAGKIADVLSKASLSTRTNQTINIDGIPECLWNNFKKRTIPMEQTLRNGIITKRPIQKNLAIEMVRDATTKHFTRFDTSIC